MTKDRNHADWYRDLVHTECILVNVAAMESFSIVSQSPDRCKPACGSLPDALSALQSIGR